MRRAGLGLALVAAAVGGLSAAPSPAAQTDVLADCRARLMELTVKTRAEAGLGTVPSATASSVAQRAAELNAAGIEGHHNASVTGVLSVSKPCDDAFDAFMRSPPHRRWILEEEYCGAGWGAAVFAAEPLGMAIAGDFVDEGPEACVLKAGAVTTTTTTVVVTGAPERRAGADRYGTAAEISRAAFGPGVDVAYIATGEDFPDALTGGAASGGAGPILLVTATKVPSATASELRRLAPGRLVVLGGAGVVSPAVEAALERYTSGSVTRQAGADRYATAAAVSAAHFQPGVRRAYVATGEDFPDGLAAAQAAVKSDSPILLTMKDRLPSVTASELRRLSPGQVVVVGGTGAVSPAVESALAKYTSGSVTRQAGGDRHGTAVMLSMSAYGVDVPLVYVASGGDFPDALAAGAAAAALDGPLLLVSSTAVPATTARELRRLAPERIIIAGGTAAVSESVSKTLATHLR